MRPVVALLRVPQSEVSKYGIVEAKQAGERLYELTGMVEKPAPEKAPSDFAIIGRYVLTPEIFDLHQRRASRAPAAKSSSPMRCSRWRSGARLYGYEFEGTRYDLGDRVGYITAQIGLRLETSGGR